jgi:hypothetical protein
MDKYQVDIEVGGNVITSEVLASSDLEASQMCLLEARWNNPSHSKKDFEVLKTIKLTNTHIVRLRGRD